MVAKTQIQLYFNFGFITRGFYSNKNNNLQNMSCTSSIDLFEFLKMDYSRLFEEMDSIVICLQYV